MIKLRALLASLILASPLAAQRLTTPEEALGFSIGADYRLATYRQLHSWWEKLAAESPRMLLDTIGTTEEGRQQVMAIISSPANLERLDHYRSISERLARARIDEATARSLAAEGKAVVWIDGGLHATEVLGATQLLELVWQFVSQDDAETRRILDDVIILAVHANPDGHDLVSDWYMRRADTLARTTSALPRLYQKYIGHDNNRDFYRNAQAESRNISAAMYTEWYPQVMYNHHQTGPSGTVMFAPPFRDPFNYNYDPMIPTGLDFVGAAMHRRFTAEGKGGTVSRDAANYSTWWNGGLRTTAYFHNIIGILTETIGSPTPMTVPLRLERQLPAGGQAMPVEWGTWKFRQSVDYSMTANRSILDLASRYRESILFNIWRMGRNSIERGSTDHWTHTPALIEAARAAAEEKSGAEAAAASEAVLRDPARRDPRAWIIPAGQPEMGAVVDFLEAMRVSGIEIQRTTAAFSQAGRSYPAGSFLLRADQAFRPHLMDMFEPQHHPTDLQYPGGPPKAPYDNAGWTLAMQMGFQYDRLLEMPTVAAQPLAADAPVSAAAPFDANAGAWLLSPSATDAFLAVNRILKSGGTVERLASGDFVVRGSRAAAVLSDLAGSRGLATNPAGSRRGTPIKQLRVALWDSYGGSMPSGWTRWLFEQYQLPFERVFVPRLNAGNLIRDYDMIVFVSGAIPSPDQRGGPGGFGGGREPEDLPTEYQGQFGRVSADSTIPALREFLEAGGSIITIGSSTNLARHLGIPVESRLVERRDDGSFGPISRDRYYVPGSLLEVAVDNSQPAARGAGDHAIVMFDNSPVFTLPPDAAQRGITPMAWFDSAEPLRSGWAHGQEYLRNGVAMLSARHGKGMLYLYGPEVLFRAQPTGTYRYVFNLMYRP